MTDLVLLTNGRTALTTVDNLRQDHKTRFAEFFAAQIRNPHTRRAYMRATIDFLTFIERTYNLTTLQQVQPLHVASWVEHMTTTHAAPTVKARLAAIRHLFDWLATGHVLPVNPAHVCAARAIP